MDNPAAVSLATSQDNAVPEIALPNNWCREGEKHSNPEAWLNCLGCNMNRNAREIYFDHLLNLMPYNTAFIPTLYEILKCFLDSITNIDDYSHIRIGRCGWTLCPLASNVGPEYSVFIPAHMGEVPSGILQREIPDEPTTRPRGVHWAQRQIASCIESHEQCQHDGPPFLPTRLINIQPKNSSGDVVLEESSTFPPTTRYAAVSYCWGGYEPKCKTTASTLSERQRCIPWHTLPRTFQDAIEFLRALEIPYLWIDSVCIVQDDTQDWIREAGKMYHVYGNSYVTLAAGGPDSRAGFWNFGQNREVKQIATLRLGEKCWPLYRRISHGVYCHWGRDGEYSDVPKGDWLFQRAWAYQERLLAPRVVYFAGDEIAFW